MPDRIGRWASRYVLREFEDHPADVQAVDSLFWLVEGCSPFSPVREALEAAIRREVARRAWEKGRAA